MEYLQKIIRSLFNTESVDWAYYLLSQICVIISFFVVFKLADKITVLVYGRGIATDAPEAIRNNPEVQAAYLGEGVVNNGDGRSLKPIRS